MTPFRLPRDRERLRNDIFYAKELAKTGAFLSWREVEAAMVSRGRPNAIGSLNSFFVRRSVDVACNRARRRLERD